MLHRTVSAFEPSVSPLASGSHFLDLSGHASITTTATYLRSAPQRLARALHALEAAGFAHHSHTAATDAPEYAVDATDDAAANRAN